VGGRRFELDDLYRIPYVSDPRLSPDGTTIAFVVTHADRERDENVTAVWSVAVATGERTQLTHGPSASTPRWSPDGRSLAVVVDKQLAILPVGLGGPRTITEVKDGVSAPAWSPDGSALLYVSTVRLDGEPDERRPIVVDRLRHKADGRGLLADRRQHVFVVPADGGDPVPWTSGDVSVSSPAWSPDRPRIAVATAMGDRRDLHVSTAL
jgi:dipeptidyl aminopeptidase/acylaminoacyl peptidase